MRLLIALLAVLCHGTAHPALPPAEADAPAQKPAPAATGSTESDDNQGFTWFLPPVRIGGTLSYGLRRDSFDGQQRSQSGLTATLNASTNTYIWQPWFARVNGGLGFTTSTDSSGTIGAASSSKSVVVTGSGQLSVLAQSKFPFQAHFQRNDSRASSDLALANGHASQRYGFTQRYYRPEGDASLGWDRSTQTSADAGRDLQDSLQLRLAHRLEFHRLQLSGDRATNKRENTGERAVQNNLSLQHSYTPDPSISVESLANISRSDYRLQQGNNDMRLLQLSSNAFWRPQGKPMTVTGGVRMFALESDSTGFAVNGNLTGNRFLNANANLGVNYEFNRFIRINAGVNVNMVENNGVKTLSSNTNQSVGASYQPDAIELGTFRYNWGASANLGNQTGNENSDRQLTLQLSHNLSRSTRLEGGSTVAMNVSQSVSATASGSAASSPAEARATQHLTHSGSLSWDLSQQAGAALVRLSASDSRALDGKQEFFQLINFQASSNLPTSGYSSWTGNLTVQAVRQGANTMIDNTAPLNPQILTEPSRGFVTNSGGSISYQNQRVLGVRRLRFVSDLRLNSQSLLPLLGSGKGQELAAWGNRLSYSIGRTQLQASMQISSSSPQKSSVGPVTKVENVENVRKINKSIMFSISRSFGDF
nr:hypothetical protein [Rhodoferax sp.]